MSVEINIHTKSCKVKRITEEKQSEYANLSEEKMIEIQAEAYYRAMKRIEEEKSSQSESVIKREYKVWEKIAYFSNVIIFPWKINKRFNLNKMYDALLVLIISSILKISGTLMWLTGVMIVINDIVPFVPDVNLGFYYGALPILFGSIVVVSGSEFEKETDSNKIYAYSGAILAIISCIVSIVAIFVSKR